MKTLEELYNAVDHEADSTLKSTTYYAVDGNECVLPVAVAIAIHRHAPRGMGVAVTMAACFRAVTRYRGSLQAHGRQYKVSMDDAKAVLATIRG